MPEMTKAEAADAWRLRLHRIGRWLERAQAESASGDRDTAFLLHWIAFNAAYARDRGTAAEVTEFRRYFRVLLRLDTDRALRDAVCRRFGDAVRTVVENERLFERFWEDTKDRTAGAEAEPDAEWKRAFRAECVEVRRAIQGGGEGDPLKVLVVLFRRLYTLRNQLVHGGAAWNSALNRDSVVSGERILAFTVPIFFSIMRENPEEDWGAPPYWAGIRQGRRGDRGTPPGRRDADVPPPPAGESRPRPGRPPSRAGPKNGSEERKAGNLILRLQHIGTAYLSHASAAERLGRLGLPPRELRTDQGRGFQLDSRVLLGNECWLHVVHNWNPEARVCRYLRSVGEGLEHLALEVADIEAAVERVKRSAPIFEDTILRAADGFEAFVTPEDAAGFTVELIQPHETSWNWPDPPPERLSPLLAATHLTEVVAVAPDPAAAAARFGELFGLPSRPASADSADGSAVLVPFPNRCALRFERPADPDDPGPALRTLVLETPAPEADRRALEAAGVGTRPTAGGGLVVPPEAAGFEVVLRPVTGE